MEQVFKTAVGVFVGGLAAALVFTEIQTTRLEMAAKEAITQMNQKAASAMEAQRQAQQAEALRQAKVQADEWQRAKAAQNIVAEAQAMAQAQTKAKEDAWKRFHQPTDACRANWSGDCADAFIKAKRAFEESYRPGQ